MTTLMIDPETLALLDQLAEQDETQPGNRSNTVRRLIRDAAKKFKKNKNSA